VINPLRREGDAFKVLLYVIAAAAVIIGLTLLIRTL
jgi:hypothetical protein